MDFFVDALADDINSEVELSDAEYSFATNFTQDTELTQETLIESIQNPESRNTPIPTSMHVLREEDNDDQLNHSPDGLLPGVAEKIFGGNRKSLGKSTKGGT